MPFLVSHQPEHESNPAGWGEEGKAGEMKVKVDGNKEKREKLTRDSRGGAGSLFC